MDIFNRIDIFTNYKDVSNDKKIIITDTDADNVNVNVNDNDNANDNANEGQDVIDIDIDIIDVIDVNRNEDNEDNENNDDNEIKYVIDVNNEPSGSLIYDILHIFDDIYVYGRTLIENNYFNLSENDLA